jgi:hypothetical protein
MVFQLEGFKFQQPHKNLKINQDQEGKPTNNTIDAKFLWIPCLSLGVS